MEFFDSSIVFCLFLAGILAIWPGDSAVVTAKAMAILFALIKKCRFNCLNGHCSKTCDFIDEFFYYGKNLEGKFLKNRTKKI